MKTHIVKDLYAWLHEDEEGEFPFVGTYQECLNFVGSRDLWHSHHEIIELTPEQKEFYNSITYITIK